MQIGFQITLPAIIKKHDKYFIASCPVLDVNTQGKNITEAKRNLVDALQLFITSCFERNVLDDVLSEAGFKPISVTTHSKKKRLPQNYFELPIRIPLELLSDSSNPCHV